jgi:hypothetical protein
MGLMRTVGPEGLLREPRDGGRFFFGTRILLQLRSGYSGNPYLTGVGCINMDDRMTDDKIRAIFETAFELRPKCPSRL